MFDLRTSPFYLLGVSPRDNRAIIAQATETAIAEGTLDETAATRAQQVLMAPRLRLGAELNWLPGLAPNRVKHLIEEATLSADAITGLPLLAGAKQELDHIEQKLEEQRRRLGAASSGDERRSITESVRHIRQQVARLRLQPEHRGRYLELKLNDLISRYNELARPEKPTPQSERFDQQAAASSNELKRRTDAAFDLADVIIDQMDTIYWRTLWQKADFVSFMFERASKQRHLAANKETFDLLVADGENAVTAGDVEELRIIVLRMWDNQITTENISGDIRRLASVLRG